MKMSLILVGRDLAKAEGCGDPAEIELYKQTWPKECLHTTSQR